MPRKELPKNDGWKDVAYEVGANAEDNKRIGAILNEACHVFRHHAEGTWVEHDRDAYAQELAKEIAVRPGLVGRLLHTEDRVVKMVTYRALELLKRPPPRP
jgi:hypothetical protein